MLRRFLYSPFANLKKKCTLENLQTFFVHMRLRAPARFRPQTITMMGKISQIGLPFSPGFSPVTYTTADLWHKTYQHMKRSAPDYICNMFARVFPQPGAILVLKSKAIAAADAAAHRRRRRRRLPPLYKKDESCSVSLLPKQQYRYAPSRNQGFGTKNAQIKISLAESETTTLCY